MKIVIASSGRAHLLECAKALLKQGHDVCFYAYSKKSIAKTYNFPKERFKSLFWLAAPFLFIQRVFKFKKAWIPMRYLTDHFLAWRMPKCDVFISQSPNYPYCQKYAKKKYGATILLDRGSSHVLFFYKLLKTYCKATMRDKYLALEQEMYEDADYIVAGSEFIKDSFIEYNIPAEKVFVNNYGVDLTSFYPTELKEKSYDLIMVGQWSKRKGCDILSDFLKNNPNYTLLHVGTLYDVDFPQIPNATHHDPVPEKKLVDFYSQAKVFILPSREDGFGLVLSQAVACGLPAVLSKNTGAKDIRNYIEDEKWILVFDDWSLASIKESIDIALNLAKTQVGKRCYSKNIKEKISWDAYGVRYNDFLTMISKNKK